ncbi:MAG TPA: aminotransferase class III-fold pyridoxal phosphate-dependent enzyme, partial [Aggregatilineales bacterium]|nr:aminotransferase class III-fold pyridoxal phosphate-dependent enzyme [Aggregatilineales bacterium]
MLLQKEREFFIEKHPRSYQLFLRAKEHLHEGVPMNWMVRYAGDFPLFVSEASGAHFKDVDGHEYIDFCLGDTGAMTGHAPMPALEAITAQLQRGITFMLPIEDSLQVSAELARRFGLAFWQFTLTATDANRFAIRLARHITGRSKILVFNWCYHGTVDETFITINDGIPGARPGNIGPAVDPTITTKVIEFND